MKPLTLQQLAALSGGTLIQGDPEARADSVSTDSRRIVSGTLFIALSGERFDGHDFVARSLADGAVAAMVSREVSGLPIGGGIIRVDDTLAGLQRLAGRYRNLLDPFVAVAITGSNGKTSTKDFLTSVLNTRFKVNATRGNLNNHIGLPLTVLATDADHTAGVWEMGMNHFGEIAPLAAIARPDIAVVTNIGTAHIEFLGSREGIALEKGRLVEAIAPDGSVVLNADDDMTPGLAARSKGRVVTAGTGPADIRATDIDAAGFNLVTDAARPSSRVRVEMPVPGRHMVINALLAAAVGSVLGLTPVEIKAGLEATQLQPGRLELRSAAGLHFIDDSYNANPDSMTAALQTLATLPCAGRRIAVLGRMGELGPHAREGHLAVGRAARAAGVDRLFTVGDAEAELIREGFGDPAHSEHFPTHVAAADRLRALAMPADLILVKGSRAAAMESVIALLNASAPSREIH